MARGSVVNTTDLQADATRFIALASRFIGTYAPVAQPILWIDSPPFVVDLLVRHLRPALQAVEWPGRPYHYRYDPPRRECASTHSLVLYEHFQREEIIHDVLHAAHPFNFIWGNAWGRLCVALADDNAVDPSVLTVRSPLQACGTPTVIPTRARLEAELGRPLTEAETTECLGVIGIPQFRECWAADQNASSLAFAQAPLQQMVFNTQLAWPEVAAFLLGQYCERFTQMLPAEIALSNTAVQ